MEDWKRAFWGANYHKLSQIKSKYDPNMVLWTSPGINADLMVVKNGRLCKSSEVPDVRNEIKDLGDAPKNDDENYGNFWRDAGTLFGVLERWGNFPPADFKFEEVKVTAGRG
jgi:hypothetical protein